MDYTTLGDGNAFGAVSRVSLGCWPFAGISSLDVQDDESIRTVEEAFQGGVNFFDTAFAYGYEGRSDRVLRRAKESLLNANEEPATQSLNGESKRFVIASKVGQSWSERRERIVDGRPQSLIRQAEQVVQRLGVKSVDLMYLHCPDPQVPIEESAAAIQEICERGLARSAGLCNATQEQAARFQSRCPLTAIQIPFNMLQPKHYEEIRDFAIENSISMVAYWVYQKGLLAGHFARDHRFAVEDPRRHYPIYRGSYWEVAHDLIDELRQIGFSHHCTVAQLVGGWALRQPGIQVILVGAKRSEQMRESLGATQVQLPENAWKELDALVAQSQMRYAATETP